MGPWEVVGGMALGLHDRLRRGRARLAAAPDRLWGLVESERLVLGLSPTLTRALIPHGAELVERHDLSSLRVLVTTGEPWDGEPWPLVASSTSRRALSDHQLARVGRRSARRPLRPRRSRRSSRCSLRRPRAGDGDRRGGRRGKPLGSGKVGGLRLSPPVGPGMTRGFLGRPRPVPRDLLVAGWPGMWVHGDWASIDDDGDWFLHGRSDDTLNVAGKRIGPAEGCVGGRGAPLGSRRPRRGRSA